MNSSHDDEWTDDLQMWHALLGREEAGDEFNGAAESPAAEEATRRAEVVSQCLGLLRQMWKMAPGRSTDQSPQQALGATPSAASIFEYETIVEAGSSEVIPERARRFGRFFIDRQLGRGGHGLVFRAIDPVLHRPVALKIPNPESLASPELRRRFVEESRTLARLDHPNLLPTLEAGNIGPVCYLVTPYCAGPSLAEWLRRQGKPVDCALAARLVRDLARTVGYVHSRGILHRDIKPSNVLLEPIENTAERSIQPEFGFIPKLADFGLAKLTENPATHTLTGAVVGTPAYMAPEQAEGRHAEVGVTTDVYALGAILYELLAGRPPYRGESIVETLRLISEARLTPLKSLRANLPRDLCAICQKCLEYELGRRYRSADDLADDLTAFLETRMVLARPCGPLARLAKWGRRRPLVASLAASLMALVLIGFIIIGWQWHRTEAHRQQAEQSFAIAHTAIKHVHDVLFEDNQGTYDTPEYYALQKTVLEAAVPYYGQLLHIKPTDPQLRMDCADVFMRLGHMAAARREPIEALDWFEKSAAVWRQLVEEAPANREYLYFLAKMECRMGEVLRMQNDPAAVERLQQAAEILQQLVSESPSFRRARWQLSEVLQELALLHLNQGDVEKAERLADRAIEVLIEIPLEERETRPMIQRILAEAYLISARAELAAGRADESSHRCREALTVTKRLVAQNQDMPSSANTLAKSLQLLGQLSAQRGDHEHASDCFLHAIRVSTNLVSSYPEIPKYQLQLADLHHLAAAHYSRQNQFSAALKFHEQAIALLEQLAQSHPANAEYQILLIRSHYRSAAVFQTLHRFEDATASMDRAKDLLLRLPSDTKSKLSEEKYGMAELFRVAAQIRTAAGEHDGGIEGEWHRHLLRAAGR